MGLRKRQIAGITTAPKRVEIRLEDYGVADLTCLVNLLTQLKPYIESLLKPLA